MIRRESILAALRAARRYLFERSRPFKLTGPGWVFILYTIGVGAGAINTGNNLLYLIFGVFLGIILASGVLSDMSLWGLRAEVELPETARAGETAIAFVRVTNHKRWLPSLAVHVEVDGELRGQTLRFSVYVPFLATFESTSLAASVALPSRGLFIVRRITLQTRYPFGLLRKWWAVRGSALRPAECLVYPKVLSEGATPIRPDSGRDDDAFSSSDERPEGSVVVGVRDYRPGDNPRRIHWKGSAKRGAAGRESPWLVQLMDREQREAIRLRLPSRMTQTGPDSTERFVSFAATLLEVYAELGFDVGLLLDVDGTLRVTDRSDPDASWKVLALWEPSNAAAVGALLDAEPPLDREADHGIDLWAAFQRNAS